MIAQQPAGTDQRAGGVSPALAASISASALVLPAWMGFSTSPSPIHPVIMAWYLSLRQPWFKPPDALVPVAWTAIEAGLAVTSYRLLRASPSAARVRALCLLGANVVSVGAWSRLFFGRKNLGASVLASAAMVGTGVALVQQAGEVDKTAARAAMPFVAWVGFATVLTAAIWRLNRA